MKFKSSPSVIPAKIPSAPEKRRHHNERLIQKMLTITDLTVEIDGKTIINGLSLHVPAGEVHAIMGPNGAGKSTLSYALTGRSGYEVTAVRH
jgi:ABC-type uncharacterized transport system ATPase subunit